MRGILVFGAVGALGLGVLARDTPRDTLGVVGATIPELAAASDDPELRATLLVDAETCVSCINPAYEAQVIRGLGLDASVVLLVPAAEEADVRAIQPIATALRRGEFTVTPIPPALEDRIADLIPAFLLLNRDGRVLFAQRLARGMPPERLPAHSIAAFRDAVSPSPDQ